MKLTDTQLVVLSAAAQRDDRAVELSAKLIGDAGRKVVRKLLSENLLKEIPALGSLPVWHNHKDEGPLADLAGQNWLRFVVGAPPRQKWPLTFTLFSPTDLR
jgi:hypothetical protein